MNFFSGGPNAAISTAFQTVDLSSYFSFIDGGTVGFELAGYFGGFSFHGDYMVLTVNFRNGSGTPLGSAALGPVTVADRGSSTALLLRSTTGTLPIGTRDAVLTLTATRFDGVYNDGYADNVSFAIAIPEPVVNATLAGMLVIAFATWRRRR